MVDHNKIVFTEPDASGGMAEGVRMLLVAFPNPETTLKHQVADDDYVNSHVKISGTNTGSCPRLPEPTGRHTEWESMVLFRMEDGKIAEV